MAAAPTIEKRQPVFTEVAALRPDTSGHNLTVKVLDAKLVLSRPGRLQGPPTRIAECLVGDQSGVIVFTARNEQVDIMQPGSYAILRNAKIDMFRGSMRLAVNQWGKVEAATGLSFEPKTEYNLSLVEYELVQVPDNASKDSNGHVAVGNRNPIPGGLPVADEKLANGIKAQA
ncbi:hypothetical protein WJX72_003094 [[Myrmecia] bisecta]|uniref:Single-stranded DNA binding protein Ssb-like OB fold domain-containing protein n=1 Tax=[Myrmecia] bisecta TaxID=41462 RepID=A0AAW1Q6V0_9CHLO